MRSSVKRMREWVGGFDDGREVEDQREVQRLINSDTMAVELAESLDDRLAELFDDQEAANADAEYNKRRLTLDARVNTLRMRTTDS